LLCEALKTISECYKLGKMEKLRSPIITVAGHVDHGKTSILDSFRGTSVQEHEAGYITQKISFTRFPLERMRKACPLIEKQQVSLEIPGFLFIDTPGHAAFTNLRKRGGSLADLAILVVNIKEGIKPQTIEVLKILRENKTPFLVALNKIDTISGWQKKGSLKESIESQAANVNEEFQEELLTFQASLSQQGFDSELYYEIKDFTKKIALVPCSARTKEGIPELLFVLCGLCQRFLKERLKISKTAKGVILEVKKEKGMESVEAILYDGILEEGDEIVIASLTGMPILSKVRAIEEIEPLSFKYKSVKEARAATGIKIHLTNKEGIVSGMPFQKLEDNLNEIKKEFGKEISQSIELDRQGIIVKADSLGSLEAVLFLLRQENIRVVKAGIGPIGKSDIVAAKTNLEINPLDAVILGFNSEIEEELEIGKVKVFTNEVVYKLIEDLQEWRKKKQAEIERDKLIGLAPICKLEILRQYVFRNSNPAIFGVRVLAGKLKKGIDLVDENDEHVSKLKSIQLEKDSVEEAVEGNEVAIALPGVNFERRLKEVNYLYSNISEHDFKNFKENKELLSSNELRVLQEIADLKRKKNELWGA
jgi:translation initiation factor 5B